MAPACWLYSSVGGGFRKGIMTSAHLDARHFSSFLYATGAFQANTPVLELRECKSEYVSPCVGSLSGTACPALSSTDSIPAQSLTQSGFCNQKWWGLIFLALEPWTGGAWCWAGTPFFQDIPPKILSTCVGD